MGSVSTWYSEARTGSMNTSADEVTVNVKKGSSHLLLSEEEREGGCYGCCQSIVNDREGNLHRVLAIITLMSCCVCGTPLTLICTLPAYYLADKVIATVFNSKFELV